MRLLLLFVDLPAELELAVAFVLAGGLWCWSLWYSEPKT